MAIQDIMYEVEQEVHRAEVKFPWWPSDLIHAAAIVAEESGEAVRAALQHRYEDGTLEAFREELVQTAAMAVRALANLNIQSKE